MSLTQLDHYLVLTHDLDRTRDFYTQALGMRLGPRPPLGFPGYWLYVGGTACIHVAEWETYREHSHANGIDVSSPAAGTGALDHIAFNAVDRRPIEAALRAHGVDFQTNEVPAIGLVQLFLYDPNGIKIELNIRDTA